MGINSREKGRRGEAELASKLRELGYEARRGQQFSGKNGDPDVVTNLKNIHIECKRVEHLNIDDALDQSRRDARKGEIPVVMHRKNHTRWKVTMDLEDWIRLYRDYEGDDE